ncbi:hypothetical protein EJ02DRAFT_145243 [Clathrospora elynae]|uniref:Uncharacterized protein n=1 Tax=Clathrospora elynae TaxID=706981 RepID=A0A6A5T295_9PLEO|nr:hypothetical protein EJ02DRAFT_145243 [Clathrospora elynae]
MFVRGCQLPRYEDQAALATAPTCNIAMVSMSASTMFRRMETHIAITPPSSETSPCDSIRWSQDCSRPILYPCSRFSTLGLTCSSFRLSRIMTGSTFLKHAIGAQISRWAISTGLHMHFVLCRSLCLEIIVRLTVPKLLATRHVRIESAWLHF